MGDYIKVPGWAGKIMISNDGETIACGSEYYDYVRKWVTKSGERVCGPMKWSERVQILDVMELPRQHGSKQKDVFAQYEAYPIEGRFSAAYQGQKIRCRLRQLKCRIF